MDMISIGRCPQLSAKDKDILYQYPSGARAIALADINQLKIG